MCDTAAEVGPWQKNDDVNCVAAAPVVYVVMSMKTRKSASEKWYHKSAWKQSMSYSLSESDTRKNRYQTACQTRHKPVPVLGYQFMAPISGTCVMGIRPKLHYFDLLSNCCRVHNTWLNVVNWWSYVILIVAVRLFCDTLYAEIVLRPQFFRFASSSDHNVPNPGA